MQSNALHLLRQTVDRSQQWAPGHPSAEALRQLSSAAHLQAMRHARSAVGGDPGGQRAAAMEDRRRTAPFNSPYEAYLDYTNALRRIE